jgi:heme exporter protein B
LSTEEEDRAIDVLVSLPISYSVLYLAKVSLAVFLSGIIILPFIGFMQILHGIELWNLSFLSIAGLMILALSALGVLLSQMTEKASGRDLLFPLIYFPLTVPVLLSAVQASFCLWEIHSPESFYLWLGLLGAFCIIYLTLGILLFEELIGLD